jgi:hypothetical protein
MTEIAYLVGARRVGYDGIIEFNGYLAIGGKAASGYRNLIADLWVLRVEANFGLDLQAGADISKGYIFHSSLELVLAGDGVGDDEFSLEAAYVISADAQLSILVIEG